MNNNLLSSIGLNNIDFGIVAIVLAAVILILLILNIINICSIAKLKKKYRSFMQGKDAKSLESEIVSLFDDNKFIKNSIEKNQKDIRVLFYKLASSIQKVGIIKYDAFSQVGGKLSFCLALLDENNNGFILNAVHGTEGCYTYTKKIEKGQCEIALGKEEEEALKEAMQEFLE